MTVPAPLWLIVNSASGSYDEDVIADLAGALRGSCAKNLQVMDVKQDGMPSRPDVERAGVDTVAVFAGDGTLNGCLTGLEGWGGQALALPGGTTNLLPCAIFGEREAGQIVADFCAGSLVVHRRGTIRGADCVALCEILAGPGARWADVREDLRDGEVADMARKSIDVTRESVTGSLVRLIEPELGLEDGYAGLRLVPEASGILMHGYRMNTPADWAQQGLAIMMRNFREGPHDDLGQADDVLCRSTGDDPIELMIDGERKTASREERFSLEPLALDLLGPQI